MNMTFLEQLDTIAKEDAAGLKKAAESYGDSWKSRGGIGAFMMLARKWDRINNAINPETWPGRDPEKKEPTWWANSTTIKLQSGNDAIINPNDQLFAPLSRAAGHLIPAWDILRAIAADPRPEGLLDDIRDLRRYLMLIEAEMRARNIVQAGDHRDNK